MLTCKRTLRPSPSHNLTTQTWTDEILDTATPGLPQLRPHPPVLATPCRLPHWQFRQLAVAQPISSNTHDLRHLLPPHQSRGPPLHTATIPLPPLPPQLPTPPPRRLMLLSPQD